MLLSYSLRINTDAPISAVLFNINIFLKLAEVTLSNKKLTPRAINRNKI